MSDDRSPTEPEEQLLVERIRRRDGEALAEFIRLREAELLCFIRSLSSDRLLSMVEPEDIQQEVATAALAGLDTAPLDEYTPLQWLQQIVRRRVVDAHRFHFQAQRRTADRQTSLQADRGGAGSQGLEALISASFTSPSAAFSRDVRMARLQEAIDGLAADARQAVRLRYSQGMPTKQIAEMMNKSDAAIRVLLSRTMRQLEKTLADVRPTR